MRTLQTGRDGWVKQIRYSLLGGSPSARMHRITKETSSQISSTFPNPFPSGASLVGLLPLRYDVLDCDCVALCCPFRCSARWPNDMKYEVLVPEAQSA